MGAAGLHLVVIDTAETQGTWGVFKHAPVSAWRSGMLLDEHLFLFPNRSVPAEQVSSRAQGWANGLNDERCVKVQVYLPPDSRFNVLLSQDADADFNLPDRIIVFLLSSGGFLNLVWDDRTGTTGHANNNSVSGFVETGRWHHEVLQKPSGSHTLRAYLDGVLRITDTVDYPVTNWDQIRLHFTAGVVLRGFAIRGSNPYPLVPFTPGGVSFRSSIGELQKRWNSFRL